MLVSLFMALLMHPIHETVAEVDWNKTSSRLEVALRFDALDEQWLAKRYASERNPKTNSNETSSPSKADKKQSADDNWSLALLQQSFRIAERPKGEATYPSSYHWIGRKEEGQFVWWYFEIQPSDGRAPKWIENQILLEKDDKHVNRILVLGKPPRRSFLLTRKQPRSNLAESTDESKADTTIDR